MIVLYLGVHPSRSQNIRHVSSVTDPSRSVLEDTPAWARMPLSNKGWRGAAINKSGVSAARLCNPPPSMSSGSSSRDSGSKSDDLRVGAMDASEIDLSSDGEEILNS